MPTIITPSWEEGLALFRKPLLNTKIFDLRPLLTYSQSHFRGARQFTLSPLLKRQLTTNTVYSLLKVETTIKTLIICYHTNTSSNAEKIKTAIKNSTTVDTVYMIDLSNKHIPDDLCAASGTRKRTHSAPTCGTPPIAELGKFSLSLPSGPRPLSVEELRRQAIQQQHPSKILPFLYLGNDKDAQNDQFISEKNINNMINITQNIPEKYPTKNYLTLRVPDNSGVAINQYFLVAIQFIEQARTMGKNVLVHCNRGISRSATLIMAYLLYCQYRDGDCILLGDSRQPDEHAVYAKVKQIRNIIAPNFRFHCELMGFEKMLQQLPLAKYYQQAAITKLQTTYAMAEHDLSWLIQYTSTQPLALCSPT